MEKIKRYPIKCKYCNINTILTEKQIYHDEENNEDYFICGNCFSSNEFRRCTNGNEKRGNKKIM